VTVRFNGVCVLGGVAPKYPDATTELELVNNKFNNSCIDYTSLQVSQFSLSYESIE